MAMSKRNFDESNTKVYIYRGQNNVLDEDVKFKNHNDFIKDKKLNEKFKAWENIYRLDEKKKTKQGVKQSARAEDGWRMLSNLRSDFNCEACFFNEDDIYVYLYRNDDTELLGVGKITKNYGDDPDDGENGVYDLEILIINPNVLLQKIKGVGTTIFLEILKYIKKINCSLYWDAQGSSFKFYNKIIFGKEKPEYRDDLSIDMDEIENQTYKLNLKDIKIIINQIIQKNSQRNAAKGINVGKKKSSRKPKKKSTRKPKKKSTRKPKKKSSRKPKKKSSRKPKKKSTRKPKKKSGRKLSNTLKLKK